MRPFRAAAETRSWGPVQTDRGARFRLWAPSQTAVILRLDGQDTPMRESGDGWFTLDAPSAQIGSEYAFVLPDGLVVPDPAARAQAGDVHGPSLLCDPDSYAWTHTDWQGRPWEEAVIYELHIGTFTPEGTFLSAIEKLSHLADLGVTAIEVMPVAQFSGERGWGYDGVLPYAPHRAYGSPSDFKALIDAAHGFGLMVFLDVVYNHFGPDGNYLHSYAADFFDSERQTPWGAAIDFSIPQVRRFFIDNAHTWIGEFRLDGLRLDAVDHMRDPKSDPEILAEIAFGIRAAFPGRHVHLITEDNRNITWMHERDEKPEAPLYTGEWNDDFHNTAHVIATGETEGYFASFAEDRWAKLARALAEGFVFQGEPFGELQELRGAPSRHLPPLAFVDFLQNHDQVGNRAFGERLISLTDPDLLRALSAILLLSPHVPMLFMGEEWGETRPFMFFTDFGGDLAEIVRAGRSNEFGLFEAFRDPEKRAEIPDPNAVETFYASKIDWDALAWDAAQERLAWTTSLLELRHREIVPRLPGTGGHAGRVVRAENGVIAVCWTLERLALHMRANLSATPQWAPRLRGTLLHAENGAGISGDLPPYSVAFATERPQMP
ncbi:MAG: malto-oligosyltrehalose trehalohydrolase [Pseudomonadota bacterium]